MSIRLATAAGRMESTADCTTPTSSTDFGPEVELAADDARDVEQILDEPRLRACVAIEAFERARRLLGLARDGRMICSQPRIALSGVRSSCDSAARNSSFNRLARESSSLVADSRPSRRSTCSTMPLNASTSDPISSQRVLGRAERVVVAMRNSGRRLRQAAERRRNHAFEAAGNRHRREQADDEAGRRRHRLHAHPKDKLVEVPT